MHQSRISNSVAPKRSMPREKPGFLKRPGFWSAFLGVCIAALPAGAVDTPEFFRGLNLNGPALEIDGRQWDGRDSRDYRSDDRAFENQSVPLHPPTDAHRAQMIRSSRWNSQARIELTNVPAGEYSVFVYVWEDNNPETISLALQGRDVASDVRSGDAGDWRRLGPYAVEVDRQQSIVLTTHGGAANLSGIEIWRGTGEIPAPGERADQPPGVPPEVAAHFDTKIAPLLAKHCLECHGGAAPKGGLDLSHRETALAGGESGAAIVPGKPDESLAWEYVAAGDMPQDRPPLSAEEQALLRKWIADGARWGAPAIDPFLVTTDRRAGYDWWSLQPVVSPEVPAIPGNVTARNEVDAFILAKLHEAGIVPAGEADRRTLIRRVTFDLTGLPPTPEEVRDFLDDTDARAYERLVDRLLDSSHYGERWARHWLDVIRFGESQGYERNKIREHAWRYRDWVIQAFNDNLPYDEFVRRQIAGDILYPDDLSALIATGYHVCGTWDQVGFLEGSKEMQRGVKQDHLEDVVATLGQAFLGLTVNCARCHDHKFDPISQREYYQIAALLDGVVTQAENEREGIPLSFDPERESGLKQQITRLRSSRAELESALRSRYGSESTAPVAGLRALYRFENETGGPVRDQSESDVAAPLEHDDGPAFATNDAAGALILAMKSSNEFSVETWITPAKTVQSGPARIVTISADTGRRNLTLGQDGDRYDVRLRTTGTDANGIPSLASPDGAVRKERTHVVYTFGHGLARIYVNGERVAERKIDGDLSNWDEGFRLGLGNEFTGDRPWQGQFHFLALYDRALDEAQIKHHFETGSSDLRGVEPIATVLAAATPAEREQYAALEAELHGLEQELDSISFDGVAHVVIPRAPETTYVLTRGDYRQRGDVVAPAGLKALRGVSPDFGLAPDAPEGVRRAKLAEWLSDPHNPLTARVFVNRLWYYHFGRGLVETPSDFGFNGGLPSHPELLDWLAARFVQSGWDVKELQRLIVTSATYRQQSQVTNAAASEIDADNRLLWRMNRRRLEGEAVRDAMLAVSGALNRQLGGPSYRDMQVSGGVMGTNAEFTDPTNEFNANTCRRTIYRLWARSGNLPMLEALDCPDPSVMSPVRTRTITPIQSLSLLNGRFADVCAGRFADRVSAATEGDRDESIVLAYRLAFARAPQPRELDLAREFVSDHGLKQFCLVLMNANEFLFVE